MGRRRKSKQEIAEEAIERHEAQYTRVLGLKGRPGVTEARLRLKQLHHARMKAEREAGFYKKKPEQEGRK